MQRGCSWGHGMARKGGEKRERGGEEIAVVKMQN